MKNVNLESVNNMQELKQIPVFKERVNKIRNEMIVLTRIWCGEVLHIMSDCA